MTNLDQPEPDPTRTITDDMLMQVYLSGMISGAATLGVHSGIPPAIAEMVGRDLADKITGDPAAYAQLAEQVRLWADNPGKPKKSIIITACTGPRE
ncbi:hypothetical protein PBI_SITAR_80 [Gordonia phage Sitar]|uniref:Uncharacterized protein n=2 Tax=Vividuovirus TaxID=2560251 RepID=A0A2U9PFY0_9CAUD|nr:hypothetical protein KNU17_gp78 [Gordonia phage Ailee]AWT50578.1 hypothetical protein PBI_SITAR_80 [Gordonia phage Sitar]AYR02546.1 hypothetical protein SEA_AILEE_78 [Gordonia phage Ailee]UYL87757.1 hypothetical protein SEA_SHIVANISHOLA_82 [Gordonia phage Shivanishola]